MTLAKSPGGAAHSGRHTQIWHAPVGERYRVLPPTTTSRPLPSRHITSEPPPLHNNCALSLTCQTSSFPAHHALAPRATPALQARLSRDVRHKPHAPRHLVPLRSTPTADRPSRLRGGPSPQGQAQWRCIARSPQLAPSSPPSLSVAREHASGGSQIACSDPRIGTPRRLSPANLRTNRLAPGCSKTTRAFALPDRTGLLGRGAQIPRRLHQGTERRLR